MSRSNYSDELDSRDLAMWRGAVMSAIRGARGQGLLRDLLEALDAMPEKTLIADALVTDDGEHCVLGVLGEQRGIPITTLDPEASEDVAKAFGIANALACEIVYINDEAGNYDETPEQRWQRVRTWVAAHIIQPNDAMPERGLEANGFLPCLLPSEKESLKHELS